MSAAPFQILFIVVGELLVSVTMIAAPILLMRERRVNSWIMLVGSALSVTGNVGGPFLKDQLFRSIRDDQWIADNVALASNRLVPLGSLIFAIGLLLHALHRRRLTARIVELEMILSSRNIDVNGASPD